MRIFILAVAISFIFLASGIARAEDSNETLQLAYNTALFIAGGLGANVFVFALGFRDAGLASTRYMHGVILRTVGGVSVGIFAFWFSGYSLIFQVEPGGLLGGLEPFAARDDTLESLPGAPGSVWFYHMGLALIAAAIVSGAVSGRVRVWPFLIFSALMTGLVTLLLPDGSGQMVTYKTSGPFMILAARALST